MYDKWKLTDQEIERLKETGGSRSQAQEAKKQAFIKAGGIILNPDALPDLYEACLSALGVMATLDQSKGWVKEISAVIQKALTKAKSD